MRLTSSFKLSIMLLKQKLLRFLNKRIFHKSWFVFLKEQVKIFFIAHHQYISRTLFTILMLGIVVDAVTSQISCAPSKLATRKKSTASNEMLNLEREIKEEREAFTFYKSLGIGNIPYEGN